MTRWLGNLRRTLSRNDSPRRRDLYRPALEGLEDRCLLSAYLQTNYDSDIAGLALHTEPKLINAWGISINPKIGYLWTSDNGSAYTTVYQGNGARFPPGVVITPGADGGPATPTGNVYNPTTSFQVHNTSGAGGPCTFLFDTEEGTISGWNQPANTFDSVITVDHSLTGAVYKGLALANTTSGNFLYATNFAQNAVETYDQNFQPVTTAAFVDPNLPTGYAPFGIKYIYGKIFVTYGLQDSSKHDQQNGPGLGLIDVYDTSGKFLRRFASPGGHLNAPWGLAAAPTTNWGAFSGALLVGNFGDGTIQAFNAGTGAYLGALQNSTGATISINGLWGLTFGSGKGNPLAPATTLYFAAGYNNEADGLFGGITYVAGSGVVANPSVLVSGLETGQSASTVVTSASAREQTGPATAAMGLAETTSGQNSGQRQTAVPLVGALHHDAADQVFAGWGMDEAGSGGLWNL
jgi:uncharacterized protein (TIGR03118 family)